MATATRAFAALLLFEAIALAKSEACHSTGTQRKGSKTTGYHGATTEGNHGRRLNLPRATQLSHTRDHARTNTATPGSTWAGRTTPQHSPGSATPEQGAPPWLQHTVQLPSAPMVATRAMLQGAS